MERFGHQNRTAGTEPDEEPLDAFGRKQIDLAVDTVGLDSRFGAAQINAIEIG
jgi:hypothetical protein